MPIDSHQTHLYSDPPNINKDYVDVPNIQGKVDENNDGSPGSLHSIFFGQLLQSNAETPSQL